MTHLYSVGDLVSAEDPKGTTITGRIVEASFPREYIVETISTGADDGRRYDVHEEEIKVVLDSEN